MIDLLWQLTSGNSNRCHRFSLHRLLPVAVLALLLASCVPAPLPPQPLLNEQTLLQRLRNNAGAFTSLRGMTRIRTKDTNGSVSARQVLLLAKPDNLRSEVLGPFGQPLLLLTVFDDELKISLPGEGRFLQGAATPERIARFTRAALSAEQLVRLALYDVPLIAYRDSVLTRQKQNYQLLLRGAENRQQQLEFDASGRLLRATYLRGEDPQLRVVYDRFDDDLQGFPRRVSVTLPEQAASFSLDYKDVDLNLELATEVFTLQPSAGVVTEALP